MSIEIFQYKATKINQVILLDVITDKSESIGQSFFRIFVNKEAKEEREIDNDDFVISKEESNSRIFILLSILTCIQMMRKFPRL